MRFLKRQYFTGDRYVTGDNNERLPAKPKSRFWFTIKYLAVVFRSRRLALQGRYDWDEWSRSSHDIMVLLEKSGARFQIEGLDNIRKLDKPVVFVSNHMSTLETMIFPCLIAPITDVTFVVKDSLLTMPVFGPIMRSRDPVVVSRTNSREDLLTVLNEGSKRLSDGISVIIFPQHTRRYFFSRKEFNSLGIKLAGRNDVDVVPVAIRTDFWKNGRIIKDLGPFDLDIPVNIVFGEPIAVSGKGREASDKVVEFITSRIKKWGVRID